MATNGSLQKDEILGLFILHVVAKLSQIVEWLVVTLDILYELCSGTIADDTIRYDTIYYLH